MRVYLNTDLSVSLQLSGYNIKIGPMVITGYPKDAISFVNGELFTWSMASQQSENASTAQFTDQSGPWPASGPVPQGPFTEDAQRIFYNIDGSGADGIDYSAMIQMNPKVNSHSEFGRKDDRPSRQRQTYSVTASRLTRIHGNVLVDFTHFGKNPILDPDEMVRLDRTMNKVSDNPQLFSLTFESTSVVGGVSLTFMSATGDQTSFFTRHNPVRLESNVTNFFGYVISSTYDSDLDKTIITWEGGSAPSANYIVEDITKTTVTSIDPNLESSDGPITLNLKANSAVMFDYDSMSGKFRSLLEFLPNVSQPTNTHDYSISLEYNTRFFIVGDEVEMANHKANIEANEAQVGALDMADYPIDLSSVGKSWADIKASHLGVNGKVEIIGIAHSCGDVSFDAGTINNNISSISLVAGQNVSAEFQYITTNDMLLMQSGSGADVYVDAFNHHVTDTDGDQKFNNQYYFILNDYDGPPTLDQGQNWYIPFE